MWLKEEQQLMRHSFADENFKNLNSSWKLFQTAETEISTINVQAACFFYNIMIIQHMCANEGCSTEHTVGPLFIPWSNRYAVVKNQL